MLFLLVFAVFFKAVSSQASCGSLITYRQYSALLQGAPSCFLAGCGNANSTSMSSACPSQAPCSQAWTLLQDQWQGKTWCESCGHDAACRIPGWPVLNATATCDADPHTWLFAALGNCCASGDEPVQLAQWVGQMCNGSQWRSIFSDYGGMAQDDWAEYILPWNRTVAPKDDDENGTNKASVCSNTPWYLGIFFVENLLFLAAAVSIGLFRLLWIKRKERNFSRRSPRSPPLPLRLFGISHLLWFQKKDLKNAVDPSRLTKSFVGAYVPIVIGILMAGAQVGVNMAAAFLINKTPGFGHVDIGHLGLLFCSRPRLTWLACVLGLFRESIPRRYFNYQFSRTAAKATIASVAISSTISEGLMQMIGTYYMGITANAGREKGFYLIHHLRPYWRGENAWYMYVGALMWLIACVPILLIWPLLSMYHARIFFLLRLTRLNIMELLRIPHSGELSRPQRNRIEDDFNEERALLFVPDAEDWNQAGHNPADFNMEGYERPNNMQEEGARPQDMQEEGRRFRRRPLRGGDSSSLRPEMMQESVGGSSGASASLLQPSVGGLRGGDGTYEDRRAYSDNYRDDTPPRLAPSGGQRYGQVRQSSGPLRGGAVLPREDWPERTPFEYYHLQAPIIWLGVTIGLISYAAQWLFWDGFVKASGDRFCHPKLLKTAVTWAVGSVLTGSIPFGLQ